MPARMRWTAYAGVSTALAGGVIVKALAQRPNFYSAAVYLSQSSANLMILTNLTFVLACSFLLGLQKLLYGPLRPIEVEQLYEKAWFAVTETCLAMTIFRGEIGAWFLIMFFALLAGKVWGWIGEGRVEILEQQPPRDPRWFHTRLALSLGLSVAFDFTMLEYVVKQVLRMARPDMMVMFGFEFAVLSLMSLSTAARYAIDLVEIGTVREQKRKRAEEMKKERMDNATRRIEEAERARDQSEHVNAQQVESESAEQPAPTNIDPPISIDAARAALLEAEQPIDENEIEVEGWEGKGKWMFYLDLATDFLKLVVYLSFFIILLLFYGIPIHIMRDVFLTCRSFFKRISDFVKYRTATRDMNERYPDASVEDIGREDVCIICREEMRPYEPRAAQEGQPQQPANAVAERMRPKKLPCGHVLHFSCLRSWLERQQICPTCRRPVISAQTTVTTTVGQRGGQGAQNPEPHPPAARPGPRVFQIGPLRIGVGAARGNNMFEELQQQLGDGQAGGVPQGNANGPQQYGFGIRWDGGGRRGARRPHNATVREQLDAAERQIQQDLIALGPNIQEFAFLRNMQVELDRIRAQRHGAAPTAINPPTTGPPTFPQAVVPLQHIHHQPLQQAPNGVVLDAGNENLPAGMTLPVGWTLTPLAPNQNLPPRNRLTDTMANLASTTITVDRLDDLQTLLHAVAQNPSTQVTINGRSVSEAPEHIRAMFQNMAQPPMNHVNLVDGNVLPAQTSNPTGAGGTPAAGGAGEGPPANNEQLDVFTATELHERWLESRRNPETADHLTRAVDRLNRESEEAENAANADTTQVRMDGEALRSPEPAPSNIQPEPANMNPEPTNLASQPLPSWGTTSNVQQNPTESTVSRAGAENNAAEEQVMAGSSSEPMERKDKSATVEDLVEDAD